MFAAAGLVGTAENLTMGGIVSGKAGPLRVFIATLLVLLISH